MATGCPHYNYTFNVANGSIIDGRCKDCDSKLTPQQVQEASARTQQRDREIAAARKSGDPKAVRRAELKSEIEASHARIEALESAMMEEHEKYEKLVAEAKELMPAPEAPKETPKETPKEKAKEEPKAPDAK